MWILLGQLWEKIGHRFTPTSGHTAADATDADAECERESLLQVETANLFRLTCFTYYRISSDSMEELLHFSVAVLPDLAKFGHFSNILKAVVNFVRVHLVSGKNLNILWRFFFAIVSIFTFVNGQILNK